MPTLVGILVAAVAGYFALRFMLKMIAKVPMSVFAVYLAVIGIIFLVMQLSGSSLIPAFSPAAALP
jgi:undecaprenyl-diphosphatase